VVQVKDSGVPFNRVMVRDIVLDPPMVLPCDCYAKLRLHLKVALQISFNRPLTPMNREELNIR